MTENEKKQRLDEIKELVLAFCEEHLNEELAGYALKLCDMLDRKRKISVTRGRKEIWVASIIYVIARLNFLFDPENELFLSADTICDYFGTKKSTVGNKATQIERACDIGLGAEGFCSPEISDALTLVELPNGLVIPKSMLSDPEFAVYFAEGEEAKELEKLAAEKRRERELAAQKKRKENEMAAQEKRERQIAMRKKKAEEARKLREKDQLNLFDKP
jgi:hypothetical protein